MSAVVPLENPELPAHCFVYKHFTVCSISAKAAFEIRQSQATAPIYQVNVREQRDLSARVAKTYGVTRESPQLIFIREGETQGVWIHGDIRREVLDEVPADQQV
jgi:bacillithiol system protein YtxJ